MRSIAALTVILAVIAVVATGEAGLVSAAPVEQTGKVNSPGLDWTEAYHKNGLVIFTKDVAEGRRVIAVSEVEVPPEAVFNVLVDFEHYPEFMPYVKESEVLSRTGDNEVVTYARIAPPFISERDYPLKVRLTRGSAGSDDKFKGSTFKVEWTALPEAKPEVEGVVRIKLNEGSWLAEPLDGGRRTRLTYTLLTDPGGVIPDFVFNLSNTVAIPELFDAVRKRSAEAVSGRK
jgi:ribosome-associated toxin RatA of RatAB toxin-antitoxin module